MRPLKSDPTCERCELSKKSQTVCCPTVGPPKSALLFVGEALGAVEEQRGRPFVGDSGWKLNYLLNRSKIPRKKVRIRNCCGCRPPGNKNPSKSQLQACYPYLLGEILSKRPKVIVSLGGIAFKTLSGGLNEKDDLILGTKTIDKWRGFPFEKTFTYGKYSHTCTVVPTYHPAACLHEWIKDDLVVRDFETAKQIVLGQQPIKDPDGKVFVCKTLGQVKTLIKKLEAVGEFVLDLETTGLSPHTNDILCVGFCFDPHQAMILPLRQQGNKAIWKPDEYRQIVSWLTRLVRRFLLIGQNIKFDIQFLRKLTGVVDYRIAFDTMLAHNCIDENKPHNLTFLSQWYLGWNKYDSVLDRYKKGSGKKARYQMADVPNPVVWKYCGLDVIATYRVAQILKSEIREQRVDQAYAISQGLINPIADMEYRGIQADKAKLLELSERYRLEAQKSLKKLEQMADAAGFEPKDEKPFNPRSTQQLGKLLKQVGADLKKKTPAGKPAVDKNVLEFLALKKGKAGTIARAVRDLRTKEKYIGSFLDGKDGTEGFLQYLGEGDRWRPNYNLATARTGRLSADNPAIQTLPRTGDLRSMVVPDDGDCVLLASDYEKIELCVMAWLSNDEIMTEELLSGIDLHTKMAVTARLMRDPTDEEFKEIGPDIAKDERAVSKSVNFGIPYGRGAAAIAAANPDVFPLDLPVYKRKERVQKVIDAYFGKYAGIAEYRKRQVEDALDRGQLRTTLYGRLRRLTGVDWFNSKYGLETEHRNLDLSHLEREAMNFQIQSIASMTLNHKTRIVYAAVRQSKIPRFRIIKTLHDALLFNVHRGYVDDAKALIDRTMPSRLKQTKKHKFEIPLKVETLVQSHWGEEYEN